MISIIEVAIEKISFQTRARTIDHLGREQIADCPTAISELWKNSYDAYAKSVELNIFDAMNGGLPVATLVDDGHGMSKDDFIEKWLIVGTESKSTLQHTPKEDRNGLPPRPRQGQKGIGRLSSAAMGNLLLLVSKRKTNPFAATLIDWRIFENPFLVLNDIKIPVVEFDAKEELISYLPGMFDSLMSNLWGTGQPIDKERDLRITVAWNAFEELEKSKGKESTKKAIENTIINSSFEQRHFESWPVWRNESAQGTALFISKISDDLLAILSSESLNNSDSLDATTKEKLFETLSGFIDPYTRDKEASAGTDFSASVVAWNGELQRIIVDKTAQFNIHILDQLEHYVDGEVDEDGIFRGKIKVFGNEFPNIEIKPREPVAKTSASYVGKFTLRIGTYEIQIGNTTHTRDQNTFLEEQAKLYSGFRMYRDGFRVMPYGREENDYFQIEKRRSMNAGAYFWASRRTFGGIKISSENNPNLRDKAGREGLIDNRAAKQFRELVINLLVDLGKNHFGRDSEHRKEILPKIQAEFLKAKAEEDRNKLVRLQRREARKLIKENSATLVDLSNAVDKIREDLADGKLLNSQEEALNLQNEISVYSGKAKELALGNEPSSLGSLETEYKDYVRLYRKISSKLSEISHSVNSALEKFSPESPEQIVLNELNRKNALISKRIKKWNIDAHNELSLEVARLSEVTEARGKAYLLATESLPKEVAKGKVQLAKALNVLEEIYQTHSRENESIFPPYIATLQSLRDQIDLQGLASFSLNESNELREEIGRIHALAQLGITVEIIGHEIEGLDFTIERGLDAMPDEIKRSKAHKNVLRAHHSLSEKWRFLSPLKLSGEKIYKDIGGDEIHLYLQEFFTDLMGGDIQLEVTEEFKNFRVNDLPSRLYPVFVNLINNARYWVRHTKEKKKKVLLDFSDGNVIVADNGPGVADDDLSKLFTLFFTKKASGGRGVGLYLCRANLAAGGHAIRYETEEKKRLLSGANFVIEFKGSKNG